MFWIRYSIGLLVYIILVTINHTMVILQPITSVHDYRFSSMSPMIRSGSLLAARFLAYPTTLIQTLAIIRRCSDGLIVSEQIPCVKILPVDLRLDLKFLFQRPLQLLIGNLILHRAILHLVSRQIKGENCPCVQRRNYRSFQVILT